LAGGEADGKREEEKEEEKKEEHDRYPLSDVLENVLEVLDLLRVLRGREVLLEDRLGAIKVLLGIGDLLGDHAQSKTDHVVSRWES